MNAALAMRPLSALLQGYATALPDLTVTGVELDSRKVAPGALFLAVRGHSRHGLAFAGEALQRGAGAVAWEPDPGVAAPRLAVPVIAVDHLGAHAGEIAARFWNHPSRGLFTVGVTGTDGKTSTAHLVTQALDRLGAPCAYFGTLGYGRLDRLAVASHTTPDAVRLQRLLAEQRDAGMRACAMEVSSHALDQSRVGGVEFRVAALTNVGRDHLDYHGSLESYAAAKRRLFAWPGLQAAVLNRDDARGAAWARDRLDAAVTLYGLDGEPPAGQHVLGFDLQPHAAGLGFTVRSSWGEARIDSRLLGRFNAYNLLAALAVLLHHGTPLPAAAAALSACGTVPGRAEGFRVPGSPLVVVDYAHTPQALGQILQALRPHTAGRLWCVFGCGGDRDRGKRPLMGQAAAQLADRLIVTDDNPRSEDPAAIAAEILTGIPDAARQQLTVEHDRARAIERAVSAASAQDVVLVAGKGHEDYQLYGQERRRFSDREFVGGLLGVAAAGQQP
ncbi:MAG: UDP-N-acetylmuramoyl-L-alanyl-D-glutamate--2,6-diaminopimelate ligase [Nevskia sp.]|nr:UDP-N-acetylmuramoyl-L-alanyl-D-glutamate--2,6-diaminopimelate ligase [Nevskia sp.]